MKKLEKLSDVELIKRYSQITALLREKSIIKHHNIVGDLGKCYAVDYYNNNADLPNLAIVEGLKNINAIDDDSQRYCVQSTRKNLTGLFYGLNNPDSQEAERQKFEYVIIVLMSQDFALEKILELSWSKFLELKKWNKANKAWNIPINKRLMNNSKIIYET